MIKKLSAIVLLGILLSHAPAFAAAGFADAYHNHQHWIYPAYAYCLAFGLIFLLSMFAVSLMYKANTLAGIEMISEFLNNHNVVAIIISGFLLAIPLGLISAVSWEILWLLSIIPTLAILVLFPILLANRHLRNKYLLSTFWIKWSIMIALSAIMASIAFIVLSNCHLLPGVNITYFARPDRFHPDFYFPTHPYDSLKEIWLPSLLVVTEIILALIIYWLGMLKRYICKELSKARNPAFTNPT